MGASVPASAISIVIDYGGTPGSFFTSEAQTTLAKAAFDVGQAITTSLTVLNQDVYTGTNGGSSATVDWNVTYADPATGLEVDVPTFDFGANQFVLKAGSRSLSGSTLGVGGTGGVGIGLGGTNAGASFAGAVDNMETASNTGMVRGGPVLGTLSGTLGGQNFDLNYGYALGSIAFDNDASTNWHFGYNTLPTTGTSDFYSVAVHEILHALGIGTGATWTSNVSGDDWTGTAVIDLLGSGEGLVGDGHITEGIQGRAIIDGVQTNIMQEVSMDPSITQGTRKYLTDVDLAFLSDMGWAVVPEPSGMMLAGISLCGLLLRRRR